MTVSICLPGAPARWITLGLALTGAAGLLAAAPLATAAPQMETNAVCGTKFARPPPNCIPVQHIPTSAMNVCGTKGSRPAPDCIPPTKPPVTPPSPPKGPFDVTVTNGSGMVLKILFNNAGSKWWSNSFSLFGKITTHNLYQGTSVRIYYYNSGDSSYDPINSGPCWVAVKDTNLGISVTGSQGGGSCSVEGNTQTPAG